MKPLLVLSSLAFLFACNNNSNLPWDEYDSTSTYEETKLSLEEQERRKPLSFIEAEYSYRKNFFGAFIINGTFRNKATVAVYKDPVLTFRFYTKTGTHLGDESRVWYEFIEPGASFDFETKFTDYDAASEVRIDLTGAKAAD